MFENYSKFFDKRVMVCKGPSSGQVRPLKNNSKESHRRDYSASIFQARRAKKAKKRDQSGRVFDECRS
ncbi:hypothetical protein MED193_08973 [Roseobacter sp. MED193]|nr:hypothetical protein MED193_08973 [Roseobacter sp. MED193]